MGALGAVMNVVQGYKTLGWAGAVSAAGAYLLTLTPEQVAQVVPPQYLPYALIAFGAVTGGLRVATRTPVFGKVLEAPKQ